MVVCLYIVSKSKLFREFVPVSPKTQVSEQPLFDLA